MNNEKRLALHRVLWSSLTAFVISLVWEFAHAPLYSAYQGGAITPFILARASLWDTIMLVTIAILSGMIKPTAQWCHVLAGVTLAFMVAFNLELYALATARWVYAESMPTLPFLGVGLSPLLQLPVSLVVMWKIITRK